MSPLAWAGTRSRAASSSSLDLAGVERLPHFFALQTGHGLHAGLAALAPLDHTLQTFQGVKAVALERTVAERHRRRQFAALIELERRLAPRHWHRRTGQKRHEQFAGLVVEPFGVGPGRGEVLIVEEGHGFLAPREDIGDGLEETAARIELLALVVVGVIAVLADAQDAVDGQLLAAERQGIGDIVVDFEIVLLGEIAAHVLIGELIDEHRHDAQVGAGRRRRGGSLRGFCRR